MRLKKPTTRIWYFRARYYNPAIDRFLSEDPTGFAGGRVPQVSHLRPGKATSPPQPVSTHRSIPTALRQVAPVSMAFSNHAEGAPGLAFETGDTATMQAQTSTRTRNTSMTLSHACLLSAASAMPPHSTGRVPHPKRVFCV